MKFLCIGDIIGRTGRNALKHFLPEIVKEEKVDFIVANGENAAGGFGITKKVYDGLIKLNLLIKKIDYLDLQTIQKMFLVKVMKFLKKMEKVLQL